MEEDDYYPKTLDEELSEILEAFYAMVSEEDIRKYQTYLEDIQNEKVAEGAVKNPSVAPDFELKDQDGDTIALNALLEKGPVVLVFYRGKWCPQCNATIMSLQRALKDIHSKGATLVAISPMLPDGTQALATKRDLEFSVLSDLGNTVARKYNLTFTVPENIRDKFIEWGDDIPSHNGDTTWEIPLPATYVIDKDGQIVWSFVDNDPGRRGEPADIVAAIPGDEKEPPLGEKEPPLGEKEPPLGEEESPSDDKESSQCTQSQSTSVRSTPMKTVKKSIKNGAKRLFGKKKQPPQEFLQHYLK